MKDIKKGEEVYYDYALTESSPEFELHCKCGKPSCRGIIKGTDYQKKELQEKYGNHFLPHILKKIEEEKAKQ